MRSRFVAIAALDLLLAGCGAGASTSARGLEASTPPTVASQLPVVASSGPPMGPSEAASETSAVTPTPMTESSSEPPPAANKLMAAAPGNQANADTGQCPDWSAFVTFVGSDNALACGSGGQHFSKYLYLARGFGGLVLYEYRHKLYAVESEWWMESPQPCIAAFVSATGYRVLPWMEPYC